MQLTQKTGNVMDSKYFKCFFAGWQQIQLILGTSKEEEAAPEVIIKGKSEWNYPFEKTV